MNIVFFVCFVPQILSPFHLEKGRRGGEGEENV